MKNIKKIRKKTKETSSSEEKVIAAALDEFALHGYAGARVDRIAAKAKVNKAMIYYHFKSKEKLYERTIKDNFDIIFQKVREAAVTDGEPVEALYAIINNYLTVLDSFSINIFQVFMREVAGGGKIFKKTALPVISKTIFPLVKQLIESAVESKRIRDVNPLYTFFQVIGSIIFFNMLRIPMAGTDLGKIIFKENYLNEYSDNLFKILKYGLELKR
ncbi:MAG: TetR/AcrR family transcriptional regulator [Spirochaetes bacterium]|nr:TetR/AcrR family transcriptional regulator [Spirochaetota bacterium]